MHKKYIIKDGKRFGPYFYESYREDGKVKTRYIGSEAPAASSGPRKGFNLFFVAAAIVIAGVVLLSLGGNNDGPGKSSTFDQISSALSYSFSSLKSAITGFAAEIFQPEIVIDNPSEPSNAKSSSATPSPQIIDMPAAGINNFAGCNPSALSCNGCSSLFLAYPAVWTAGIGGQGQRYCSDNSHIIVFDNVGCDIALSGNGVPIPLTPGQCIWEGLGWPTFCLSQEKAGHPVVGFDPVDCTWDDTPLDFTNEFFSGIAPLEKNISDCQELNETGMTYYLNTSISTSGTCFNITADDVTLDCEGNTITGDTSGYGVYNNGSDNVTINNCTVTNFYGGIRIEYSLNNSLIGNNVSSEDSYALEIHNSANNTFYSNTLMTSGSSAYALYGSAVNYSKFISNTIYTANSLSHAVAMDDIHWNEFEGNTVGALGSMAEGMRFSDAHDNAFTNNRVTSNTAYIDIDSISSNNYATNNTFFSPEGEIGILPTLEISEMVFTNADINISYNSVYINNSPSGPFGGAFSNISGVITLNNLPGPSAPEIRVDVGDTGIFSTCNEFTDPECHVLGWNGSTIVFNVTHFTTYITLSGPLEKNITSCQELNESNTFYRLMNDVNITGTCFNVTADDVALDCQGHSINYSAIPGRWGEGVFGYSSTSLNGISIENCTFISEDVNGMGVRLTSNNARVVNNRFYYNNYALTLVGEGLTVLNNTFYDSTRDFDVYPSHCNNNEISGNIGSDGKRIEFYNGSAFDISGEELSALLMCDTSNSKISDSNFTYDGLRFLHTNDNITVDSVRCSYLNGYLTKSSISNSRFEGDYDKFYMGVVEINGESNYFWNNHIFTKSQGALYVFGKNHVFFNNTIHGARDEELGLYSANNNTFVSNRFLNASYSAIRIEHSHNNTFIDTDLEITKDYGRYITNYDSASYIFNNTMTNTTFIKGNTSVRFSGTLELPNRTNVQHGNFSLLADRVFLNSSNLNLSFLNRSAEITFKVLNFSNPKVLVALNDATFSDCNATTNPACYNLGWNGSTFVFNVSHFTTYMVKESGLQCGDIITSDTNLTSNLDCNGTALYIGADNVTLDCNGSSITGNGSGEGVYDSGYDHITVKNCNITNFSRGIDFENGADYGIISNNTLYSNKVYGIYLYLSSNNSITGNDAYSNGDGNGGGIWLKERCSDNRIENNTVNNNLYSGIWLGYGSENNIVNNNTLLNNDGYGIFLFPHSGNNTLFENNASDGGVGIYISDNANGSILVGNTANGNGQSGIVISSSSNNISNNTASGNTQKGIYLYSSLNNILLNNTASLNGDDGIYLYSSSDNTLTDNTARSNVGEGIWLESSSNNNLTGNTANSNHDGIQLYPNSNNNLVANNNASLNNMYGFILAISSNNNILLNNSANNQHTGIYVQSCSNTSLLNNTAGLNGQRGIILNYGSNISLISGNNVSSNKQGILLDNSSYNNLEGNTVWNSSVDGIFLYLSSNNNITGNIASANTNYGILLDSSSNNTLAGNTAGNNSNSGIRLYISSNNSLTDNTAKSNYDGIYLKSSLNNILANNTASLNTGTAGIYIASSPNNTLTNNTINSNMNYGFYLSYSSDNNITGNTASNNSVYGIYLDHSSFTILTNNTANSNMYGLHLESGSNYNILTGNAASGNGNAGIYLISSNNTLMNNTANSNYDGIYLKSSYGILTNNTANSNRYGFHLESGSNYNILTGNAANSNMYGILIDSSSNDNILTSNSLSGSASQDLLILSSIGTYLKDQHADSYSLTSSGLIVENTSAGKLAFLNNSMTVSGSNLSSDIVIRNNYTLVNSALRPGFNTTANITLLGLNFINPRVMVAYDDANFVKCTNAMGCYNISWNGSTFVFNVTHFTTYIVNETVIIPAPSITVISPLNSATLASVNVTFNVSLDIDGNWCGYSLDGAANTTMNMINSTYFSLTQNGLNEGSHNVVFSCNNTIGLMNSTGPISFTVDEGPNVTRCKSLVFGNRNYLLMNDVSSAKTCFTFSASNITLNCGGKLINYSQSSISPPGAAYGINLPTTSSNDAVIKNCVIVQDKSPANAYNAINLGTGVSNVQVINNTITTIGGAARGVMLANGNSNNLISGNLIQTFAAQGADGIRVLSPSPASAIGNKIQNNVFLIRNSSNAITLGLGSVGAASAQLISSTEISGNEIWLLADSAQGMFIGMRGGGFISHNTAQDNLIIMNSSGNRGIWINNAAPPGIFSNNSFVNNTIYSKKNSLNYYINSTASGNNMTDMTFSTDDGMVRYPQMIEIPNGASVSTANLNITFNRTLLNSADPGASFLNQSAEISLNDLNFTNPQVIAAMDDLNFAVCNGTTDPECHRIDWNGITIIFNVSHFTTYSINESPCTPVVFYRDADADGYGNVSATILSCILVSGYVSDSTDCNDNNSAVNPGAAEICNGMDDNCNGQIDEGGVCAPAGGGGGGGGGGRTNPPKACVEDWVCGNWSECIDGKQTRTCSDKTSCGTVIMRPSSTRTCQAEEAAPLPAISPVSATNFAAWIIWAIMALLSVALIIELVILTRRQMGLSEGYWEKQIALASKNLQSHQ